MDEIKYYLVNSGILPEIFSKVIEAKGYLASGEADSTSQAVRMAGISRSAYYKYKDAIFEYSTDSGSQTVTINAKLRDNAGVLSSMMQVIYECSANVLSVNQSVPINSVADVSVTVRTTEMTVSIDEMVDRIRALNGVSSVKV